MKRPAFACALLLVIFCILSVWTSSTSAAEDYLVGVWQLPDNEHLSRLMKAGLNALIIPPSKAQIERAKDVPLKKIPSIGVNIPLLKSLERDWAKITKTIDERFAAFDVLDDVYGYYMGDDVVKSMKKYFDYILTSRGLKRSTQPFPLVGLMNLKSLGYTRARNIIDVYGDDEDVFTYHHPLMCRTFDLSKTLKIQVQARNRMHAQHGGKSYVHVQVGQQEWYKGALSMRGSQNQDDLLYPDGQTVRMLLYYAMASGSDGFFLFAGNALVSEVAKERVLGITQTLFEAKPLLPRIANDIQTVELIQKDPGKLFTTVLKGLTYDIIFCFASDMSTVYYHPSTKPIYRRVDQLVGLKYRGYKTVYTYSPLGLTAVSDKTQLAIAQDQPLILIGAKGEPDLQSFALSIEDLPSYLETLKARADVLRGNIQRFYSGQLPEQAALCGDTKQDCASLLTYIAALNEVKREAWLTRSPQLPVDGDSLAYAYWHGGITQEMVQGQVFNFYY